MIHSFLLVGQSNAAGRGIIKEAAPLDTCEKKLKVLRNGLWLPMYRPVNPDRPFSGTCLAETFAKEYYLDHRTDGLSVGIIPCADGGTSIKQWKPGEILFDNAVNCARLAMRTSSLKGIIWHQGESDCSKSDLENYAEDFKAVMDGFRRELSLPELPVIIGGLGDYLANYTASPSLVMNFEKFNALIENVAAEYPNCAFVSAKGLGANSDNLHFCAEALAEFGVRYYNEYKKLDVYGEDTPSETAIDRSAMEML